jgi:arabinogalactan oligomer/maltooligosaccharide transport system substrate-binding protein
MSMRRTTTLVAVLAGSALALAACGSGGGGSTTTSASPTAASSSAPASTTPLVVWAGPTQTEAIKAVALKFEQEKGVKVKVVEYDFGKIRDDLISQGPSGKGPDVIVGAHDWVGKLVQNGAVAPLELGDKASEFSPVSITAMTSGGKVYGLPFQVENIALMRNAKLAPEAPATIDDVLSIAKGLGSKIKYPLVVQQDPTGGDPYHLYPWQTSMGSAVFGLNPDGTYNSEDLTIGNAQGIAFANELPQLVKDGVLKSTITYDIAKDAFLKGQTPFWITGPWSTADVKKAGIDLAIDPIPTVGPNPAQPFVGVQGFMVSAYTKQAVLANEFVINYLGTPEVAKALFDIGQRAPAMTSVFEQVKSDPILAGFGAVGATGVPMPNIPEMDAVWADWGSTEAAIIQGKGDPTKLWTKMSASIQKKIDG